MTPTPLAVIQQNRGVALALAAASAAILLLIISSRRPNEAAADGGRKKKKEAKNEERGSKFAFPPVKKPAPSDANTSDASKPAAHAPEKIEADHETPLPAVDETPEAILSPRTQAEAEKKRGNEYYQKKDFPEAIKAYTKAHELDPSNPIFLLNRAAATLEHGDMQSCLVDCVKVFELEKAKEKSDPAILAKAFSRMGTAYQRLGLLKEAYTAFATGRERAPCAPPPPLRCLCGANAVLRRLQEDDQRAERERESAQFEEKVRAAVELLKQGAEHREEAVGEIARAVRELTDTINGLQRLQRLIPELIFADVIRALDKDDYFDEFPPKEMNARVKPVESAPGVGRGLFATRGVKAGAAALREKPFVAIVVDDRREEFCNHCLKPLQTAVVCEGCEAERYCSPACKAEAHEEYHGLLCVPKATPAGENPVERLRAHCAATRRRDPLVRPGRPPPPNPKP
eukprot:tig00020610_g12028.t1